jgi:hypothetical protein
MARRINTTYVLVGAVDAIGLTGGFVARPENFQPQAQKTVSSAQPCWRLQADYDSAVEAARNVALNLRRAEFAGQNTRPIKRELAQVQAAVTAIQKEADKTACTLPDHVYEPQRPAIGGVAGRDLVSIADQAS